MRPESLAEAVEQHLASGLPLYHNLNEFLDEFYTRPAERQGMIESEPAFIGDARGDAYVGGVGEHLALRWMLRVPAWVYDPRRFLRDPWYVDDAGPELAAYYLMESPMAFRRRLIFTEAEPLRRARFPWHELGLEPA